MKAAEQLCDDLHWSVAQNRSTVPTLFMEKPTFHFTLSGKKCCLLLLPDFSGSSATTSRTLQHTVKSPQDLFIYLPLPPSMTLSQRVTLDYLYKRSSFGKPGLVCPVFSYKLPDTGFRKICQEIKI